MWGTHHGNAAISGCLSRNQLSQRSPARPFLDRSHVRFQGASCPGLSPSPHFPVLSCMRLKVPLSRTSLSNLIQSRPSTAPPAPLQHLHIPPSPLQPPPAPSTCLRQRKHAFQDGLAAVEFLRPYRVKRHDQDPQRPAPDRRHPRAHLPRRQQDKASRPGRASTTSIRRGRKRAARRSEEAGRAVRRPCVSRVLPPAGRLRVEWSASLLRSSKKQKELR